MNTKLEHIENVARKRGGKLISCEYSSKLVFECFYNHIFTITPSNLKLGRWCPDCKKYYRTEEICRVYFEHIFGTKFEKIRPNWLINEHGNRLELDGYSDKVMVAFEYNGKQHYSKTSWFDLNLAQVEKHEIIKKDLCKKMDVCLVILHYKMKIDDFLSEIKKQLVDGGFNVDGLNWSLPSLKTIYTSEKQLSDLKTQASSKKITLLDLEYRGSSSKYKLKCNVCGRCWSATPYSLKKNGCKKCSGKERHSIEDAKLLAKSRGGKCLSEEYINNSGLLEWECGSGHKWKASFNAICSGNWCPIEGKNKKRESVKQSWDTRRVSEATEKLSAVKNFTEKHGFKCVSDEYINCDFPLTIICKNDHVWKIGFRALKNALKNGRGCTYCGRNSHKITRGKNVKN